LQAFRAERTFILVTTKAKKPDSLPPALITELHKASDTANMLKDSNRPSPYFNHLSAIAEGIFALGWFSEPEPAEVVKSMIGSIEYYGNKVLKEYKDKYGCLLLLG
jgi:adenylyl cyclase-associated protein